MDQQQASLSLQGSCHCGAVRLTLPGAPEKATSCNCSLCRRTGAIFGYYEFGTVSVEGHPENTEEYIWGDRTLRNIRCKICGILTHWEPLDSKPGARHGVNLRNFDPRLLESVVVRHFDGAGSWTFLDWAPAPDASVGCGHQRHSRSSLRRSFGAGQVRRETAMVTACRSLEQPGWLALRQQLWPHSTREEHLAEMSSFLAARKRFAQFVEYDDAGVPLGFIEIALRTDSVNGTESSPVAFLEGIFVVPEARKSGVARRLVAEAERWAKFMGCKEFASDARIENTSSHAMHVALGFAETERVVFFKKLLQ